MERRVRRGDDERRGRHGVTAKEPRAHFVCRESWSRYEVTLPPSVAGTGGTATLQVDENKQVSFDLAPVARARFDNVRFAYLK